MTPWIRAISTLVGLSLIGACTSSAQPTNVEVEYAESALALMDEGLNADAPEWDIARNDAIDTAREGNARESTYRALARAVKVAGGPHSQFRTPVEVQSWENAASAGSRSGPAMPTASVADGVVTIHLPSFPLDDPDLAQAYADAGVVAIVANRQAATCGWAVDVESDQGGNVYPMLAAVSPLLDDGIIAYSIGRDGKSYALGILGTSVILEGKTMVVSLVESDKVDTKLVAVRQSRMTASAGEAVVVAFTGQNNVQTIGQPTRGFTTGNVFYPLKDGAAVTITTTTFQDRDGKLYGGAIDPEHVVASDATSIPGRQTAGAWLQQECA